MHALQAGTRFSTVFGNGIAVCLLLVITIFSPTAMAADADEAMQSDASAMEAELKREASAIRVLAEPNLPAAGERREAMLFQRDQRALEWLTLFDRFARKVLAMPPDSSERLRLQQVLAQHNSEIDDLFGQRLNDLESRLNAKLAELDAASGVDKIPIEALAEALNEQRLRYMERLIDVVLLREKLGLGKGSLEEYALQALTFYGEELVGFIELRSASQRAIKKQLSSSPDNADLKLALEAQQRSLEQAVGRLDRVVELLNRVGVTTDRFRSTLVAHQSTDSIAMLDAEKVAEFFAGASRAILRWAQDNYLDFGLKAVLFLVIIVIARWLARFVRMATHRGLSRSGKSMSHLLHDVLVSFAGGAVLTIGVLVALNQIGISVAPMLAGLGVAGFVIGFALQDTLSNFAAGAMILAYRPFDTGDYVEVATVAGTVKRMNLVNTTIATIDNKLLIVPNGKIWGDVIQNFTGVDSRRVDMIFGISYSDDIDHAERILNEIVADVPMILSDPPTIVRMARLNDSSVDFIVRPWVRPQDYWETLWMITKAVKQRFDSEGITIPFPQRDVHLHGASLETAMAPQE